MQEVQPLPYGMQRHAQSKGHSREKKGQEHTNEPCGVWHGHGKDFHIWTMVGEGNERETSQRAQGASQPAIEQATPGRRVKEEEEELV